MDFAQDRVTTLHALSGADRIPEAPTDRTAVLVPIVENDVGSGLDRVFTALETVDPERVVVVLRAAADRVGTIDERLDSYAIPLELLCCNGPRVEGLLRAHDLDGPTGRGHDVWLGPALAARSRFVAIHDADAASYTAAYVPRLLAPLAGAGTNGSERYGCTKGYYARIEDGRLYGRLCRLLYAPLVRTLVDHHGAPVLSYLDSFRYGLAGEHAMTADLARRVCVRRGWGLEVGLLGEVFRAVGPGAVAQVDLRDHDHEHRSIDGVTGLSAMAESVTDALLQAVEGAGVRPAYASLPGRYRERAEAFAEAYRADAAFSGLAHDAAAERRQIAVYAESISPPEEDDRLPAWEEAPIAPGVVREAARADLEAVADGAGVDPGQGRACPWS
jgi:glucosyl-3-phosphoglycerate synthase